DDGGSRGPLLAARGPGAVAARDEYAVYAGGAHRNDHLGVPLAGGSFAERPVRGHGDQLRAGQREHAWELRELELVADQDADASGGRIEHPRWLIAGLEEELLAIPQVGLAVNAEHAGAADDRGAVVEQTIVSHLAEPAD